ncbi:helix-turn-helix transcriptional regulator [Nocardia sp. CDC159]|uniref:Helix-turn-helix transcriptional regulator n=1 Tax=Nocardia pulmonis TaxID=2951408 RepID=A0A9X2E5P3_9NOCA|nr:MULTISPECIES: helix-turn-helix domain-containing protein [Nocardia]MCM6773553.1 helix-turn-helix transcriptional regulator [Nocardia pulmonis]MCM6786440.1 helix-turn-helix transcriptional regulator [Nocardia sp. CDC159]
MRSARELGEPRGEEPSRSARHAAMELLGQRWMLRVVWELEPGALGFLELRRRMGNCSSSMLSARLHTLQDAGLAVKRPDKSHELTPAGMELARALRPLWAWSDDWHASGAERPRR